jgi:hypothetical protein
MPIYFVNEILKLFAQNSGRSIVEIAQPCHLPAAFLTPCSRMHASIHGAHTRGKRAPRRAVMHASILTDIVFTRCHGVRSRCCITHAYINACIAFPVMHGACIH